MDGQVFNQGADSLVGRPFVEVEKYYIQRALEITGGKREEAAHLLGIGERTMYRKKPPALIRNSIIIP